MMTQTYIIISLLCLKPFSIQIHLTALVMYVQLLYL